MGLKRLLFRYYFPQGVASRAIQRMPSSAGLVLMYHEVLPDNASVPAWTIVGETDFHWQMQYLQKHFDILTMDEAVERVTTHNDRKRPFAVVTFDDGYKGNSDTVLPIMESLGIPFILYVTTRAVINKSLNWYDFIISLLSVTADVEICFKWNERDYKYCIPRHANDNSRWCAVQDLLTQLKQMSKSDRGDVIQRIMHKYNAIDSELQMLGAEDLLRMSKSDCVTIGAHTHDHELLDQLSSEEVMETIVKANNHLQSITGNAPRHFSYPNGNHNQCVIEQVQKAGYKTAVSTMPGIWTCSDSLMKIPRLSVGRFDTRWQFIARVSGNL